MSIYVMSDVHGSYERYAKAIAALDLESGRHHLYILGDVIDRGKDGIRILEEVMNHPHITLLMGNHEHMMYEYLSYTKKRYGFFQDVRALQQIKVVNRWNRNGNLPTLEAFRILDETKQNELFQFLENLPLAICDLDVDGKLYYLVHACPLSHLKTGILTMKNCTYEETVVLVWDRYPYGTTFFEDRCVVHGHTVTGYLHEERPYQVWKNREDIYDATLIDIDCGCACDNRYTRLAVMCLNDRSINYY